MSEHDEILLNIAIGAGWAAYVGMIDAIQAAGVKRSPTHRQNSARRMFNQIASRLPPGPLRDDFTKRVEDETADINRFVDRDISESDD